MKRLLDFILESRENEIYREFPQRRVKPTKPHILRGQKVGTNDNDSPTTKLYKQQFQQSKDEYKEYKNNCIKINSDNFEIMIDKLLAAMNSRQGQNNFMLSAKTCTFTNYYFGENGTRDFFDDIEQAVVKAHLALESKDIPMHRFKKVRDDKTMDIYGSTSAFSISIYETMCIIAQAYNVNIPKFNEDFDIFKIASVEDRYDSWRFGSHATTPSDERRRKAYDKFDKKYAQESQKLRKLREKFKQTELYEKIIDILDKVENDLQAVEPKFKKWSEQIRLISLEDESIENTKELIAKAIIDGFGKENPRLACGLSSLQQLVSNAYVETGEMPEIKIVDKYHAGWMAGLYHEITYEIFDSNGKSYGTTKLRDHGIRGDNGEVVDGFGPWD